VTVQLSNVQLVLVVQIDQWHGTMLNHEEHRRMSSSTETQSTQSSSTKFQFMLINCLESTACLFTMFRSTSLDGTSVLVMIALNRIWWMFMVSYDLCVPFCTDSCLYYAVRSCVSLHTMLCGNNKLIGCQSTLTYLCSAEVAPVKRITFVPYVLSICKKVLQWKAKKKVGIDFPSTSK